MTGWFVNKALKALVLVAERLGGPGFAQMLQQIQLPRFRLSLFVGEHVEVGVGKDLAYKRSSDNWKVWARS